MRLAFFVALLVFATGGKNIGVESRTVNTNNEPLSCVTPCLPPHCGCVRGICFCNDAYDQHSLIDVGHLNPTSPEAHGQRS
ncbi:unnamed protein product [Linum trigynum]|uniref:Secreted protein n=1 Tax=Linum trigynum TaxID=586398 RepID=A0AAV2DL47_9ROSI